MGYGDDQMERQGSPEERDRPSDSVGCLPNGLGSVSGPSKDERSVYVRPGDPKVHWLEDLHTQLAFDSVIP